MNSIQYTQSLPRFTGTTASLVVVCVELLGGFLLPSLGVLDEPHYLILEVLEVR